MSRAEKLCLSLLSYCKTLRNLNQIHAFVYKSGLETNPLIAGKLLLLGALQIPEAIDYARRLLIHNPNPDVFMYNTLIRGESEADSPKNSVNSFIYMLRESYSPPDSFSFAFVLKAAATLRCLRTEFQLHCQAMTRGHDTHLFVGTTMISMYAECGFVEFAWKVFVEIPEPNVVAWNAILTAYFWGSDVCGADKVFGLMPFRNLTTWNVMLAAYTKAEELERAEELFLQMPSRDDVSWSTMIVGFAHNGYFDEALRVFRELVGSESRPNEVSLTGALSACAQPGALKFGMVLHAFIEKVGLIWISSVNNALLDTYSKCGNVLMARLVFERMLGKKSIVSWTSMIAGFAMQGYGEEVIKKFHEMEESGTRPDGVTFISVLYACSHAGLVEQGHELFSKMTETYDIEPTIEHYGCMVDLYGRDGQLHKAYNFMVQMPVPPKQEPKAAVVADPKAPIFGPSSPQPGPEDRAMRDIDLLLTRLAVGRARSHGLGRKVQHRGRRPDRDYDSGQYKKTRSVEDSVAMRPVGHGTYTSVGRGRGHGGPSISSGPLSHIYALASGQDQEAPPNMAIGMLQIFFQDICVDRSRLHFIIYVSPFVASRVRRKLELMDLFEIATPIGDFILEKYGEGR
ncbi:pentatricopeptide repeat-containing protein At1g74630-like [Solanum dulcamara]|uniref:pentatricopeptide repeat-containing protein At1g74630-like n=1 Tax=Solanum dulcamara TaxID=45834 RepID=UPI002486C958|nr:pentatricopeptide repeat-containing protein At1g74630-like [Solanum dulcamara]